MQRNKITAPMLTEMKRSGEKITMLTAYDYSFGSMMDEAGIDVILIGDSLGMVVLGYDTTLQVTMDDMVRHSAAVAKGVKRALIVVDMPFMSYQASETEAIHNAGRLLSEGRAEAVKLEGGKHVSGLIRKLVDMGIPVVSHLGMTPQSVNVFGGYKTQGTDASNASRIKNEALELQDAGVCAIVLEKVTSELAAEITASLHIPTIGIGAGPDCDGQVLVSYDMLGMYDKFTPPFVKVYANLRKSAVDAIKAYGEEVKGGVFPSRPGGK